MEPRTIRAVQSEIERLSRIREEAWCVGGIATSGMANELHDLFAEKRALVAKRGGRNELDPLTAFASSRPFDPRIARAG